MFERLPTGSVIIVFWCDLKRVEDRLEGDLLLASGILTALGQAIADYARENLD